MCFQELQEQDPDLLIVCPLCVIALLEQVLAHFRHMTRSERDGVIEMLMANNESLGRSSSLAKLELQEDGILSGRLFAWRRHQPPELCHRALLMASPQGTTRS